MLLFDYINRTKGLSTSAFRQYLVKKKYAGEIHVLPQSFERQYYGIAMPGGSPLREPINRALLERVLSPEWRLTLDRYLGR